MMQEMMSNDQGEATKLFMLYGSTQPRPVDLRGSSEILSKYRPRGDGRC
jgi:hypothetical protein